MIKSVARKYKAVERAIREGTSEGDARAVAAVCRDKEKKYVFEKDPSWVFFHLNTVAFLHHLCSLGRFQNSWTLLHWAVRWDRVCVVSSLLIIGSDVDVFDCEMRTPL